MSYPLGFTGECANVLLRGTSRTASRTCTARRPRHACRLGALRMQIPPDVETRFEPPLTEDHLGPPEYKWNPDFPGTIAPGIGQDDCFPLEQVLNSGVYENMVFEELDMYERTPEIFTPDEDLLEWLDKQGRLLNEDSEDWKLDSDVEKQIAGVTEDDLDFSDDDDKMLAYYSRQGEGSSIGSGQDFGGIAESGLIESSFE